MFNGGTGTDQINFNGTTNTNINLIDFSNDYDNNNQTFYLDGDGLNNRYGVYTSVEDIQIDLDALEQFRWDGVLELDETINVTNPSAGRILIDSVGNQTVNLNTPSGVETPDDYDNVEFDISGARGNDIINLNTSELLVQQQIDGGLQNTLNLPSTNSYLDIYGDDGDDSININNTALAGEQTSINGLDEDRIYFTNNIDGGEGVDNINFTNSGTIANQEADNGDAYLYFNVSGGYDNDTIDFDNTATLATQQVSDASSTVDGAKGDINFNVYGGNENDTININNTVSKLAEQTVTTVTVDGAEGSLDARFQGDDGDDTINVNNSNVLFTQNLLNGASGSIGIYIDGGEGTDTININNSASLAEQVNGVDPYAIEVYIDATEGGSSGTPNDININSSAVIINAGSVGIGVNLDGAEEDTGYNNIDINPTSQLLNSGQLHIGRTFDGGEGASFEDTINIGAITNPLLGTGSLGIGVFDGAEGNFGETEVTIDAASPLIATSENIEIGSYYNAVTLHLNQTADLIPDGGLKFTGVYLDQTTPLGGSGTLDITLFDDGEGGPADWGEGYLDQNNTYTGQTILRQGTLNISNPNALGTTAGNTIVHNNGEIYITSGITVAEDLVLDGELGVGVPTGVSGTWSGTIDLSSSYGGGDAPFLEANNSADVLNITGVISGTTGVNIVGEGTVILTADNTYSGVTNIDGDVPATLTVQVLDDTSESDFEVTNATLAGDGTVGAVTLNDGGTLAPGTSAGIVNTGDLTFNAGSSLEIEIGGTTVSTQYDQVSVTGTVTLNGAVGDLVTLDLIVDAGYTAAEGDSFTIIDNDGTTDGVIGTFAGLGQGATVGAINTGDDQLKAIIDYQGGDGNDVVITIQSFNAVTPPSSSNTTTPGTGGNDVINVSSTSNNRVDPSAGDDYIIGSSSRDVLKGGDGNDSLFGNGDVDKLYGGDGDDILNGGADNTRDYLYGNAGADTFVLNPNNKNDYFYTFNSGDGDRIKLEGGLTFGNLTFTNDSVDGLYNGADLLARVRSDSNVFLTAADLNNSALYI